jgi:hypothetical protein
MLKLEEVQTHSVYGNQRRISNHKILGFNIHRVLVHSSEIQSRCTTIVNANEEKHNQPNRWQNLN